MSLTPDQLPDDIAELKRLLVATAAELAAAIHSALRKRPRKLAKQFAKSKFEGSSIGIRSRRERLRWPNGPICPHCGSTGDSIASIRRRTPHSSTQDGLYYCNDCRGKFTVTVGTVLQRSHVRAGPCEDLLHPRRSGA